MDFVVAAVFVFSLAVVLGGYWFVVVRPEEGEERALRKRLKGNRKTVLAPTVEKARQQLSAVVLLDRLLERSAFIVRPVQDLVLKSGVAITTGTVILAAVFLGLVFGLTLRYFSSSAVLGLTAGLL